MKRLGCKWSAPPVGALNAVIEMIYEANVQAVLSTGNGEVEVYEFCVPDHWAGKRSVRLSHYAGVVVVSITRAGKAFIPDSEVRWKSGI